MGAQMFKSFLKEEKVIKSLLKGYLGRRNPLLGCLNLHFHASALQKVIQGLTIAGINKASSDPHQPVPTSPFPSREEEGELLRKEMGRAQLHGRACTAGRSTPQEDRGGDV
jgi:hypothetical protein